MSYSPSTLRTYTPTLADVSNTASETTFCSFVVPAGTWLDGEVVTVRFGVLIKQNTGSGQSTSLKALVTGGAAVTLHTTTWGDSSSEWPRVATVELMRVGPYVVVNANTGNGSSASGLYATNASAWNYPGGMMTDSTNSTAERTNAQAMTPTSFASDITVSLRMLLASASTSYYVKPQGAMCVKSQVRVL